MDVAKDIEDSMKGVMDDNVLMKAITTLDFQLYDIECRKCFNSTLTSQLYA